EGDEPQPGRHRPQSRNQRERLKERLVLQELAGAVRVERIHAGRVLRIADAIRDDHGVEAGFLGGPGQRRVKRRGGHRLGVAESHVSLTPRSRTCSSGKSIRSEGGLTWTPCLSTQPRSRRSASLSIAICGALT